VYADRRQHVSVGFELLTKQFVEFLYLLPTHCQNRNSKALQIACYFLSNYCYSV